MKKEDWHDAIQKQLAGMATPEGKATLEAALEGDAELRALYLDYANLDMALEASAEAETALQKAQLMPGEPGRKIVTGWFSRRSVAAAAAGIMVGILTSSMVWAFSGTKVPTVSRIAIPLVDPGFEELVTPIPKTAPRALDRWSGDPSHVVASGGQSVTPREGRSMVQMQPVDDRRYSRIEQIVEVGHLIPPEGGAVELSAAFFAEGAVDETRFQLKLRAFSVDGDEIQGTTEDIGELVVSQADRSLHLPPGSTEWRTGKLRMDLPPNTNTLVFAISVRDLPETSSTASQYLDDIKATILVTETPST